MMRRIAGWLPRGLATAAASTASKSVAAAEPHGRLLAACILERLPVVMRDPPQWEEEYKQWAAELQAPKYKRLPEELTKPPSFALGPEDVYEPAPRVTEDDHNKNTKSLNRALAERLYLVVRGSRPPYNQWHFPFTEHRPAETMRQAAERALRDAVGTSADAYFIGNAPCGHFVHEDGEQAHKDMTFFYRAQLLDVWTTKLRLLPHLSEYAWVTREETAEFLEDRRQASLHAQLL
eukprot:jgi/Chlat1/1970/Chrsp158S02281